MSYYARFEEVDGQLFRFDTRIYLGAHDLAAESICVGAIVGKNPGSAKPTELSVLAPLALDGDKMLPSVRNRFRAAYQVAGKSIPNNAYVSVWNLFYLCNPVLDQACAVVNAMGNSPSCESEEGVPPVIWFAWGGNDARLNAFKQRYLTCQRNSFYYDHRAAKVIAQAPSAEDFAKHPQGMLARPVVEHLAGFLR